jgi:hypothetical protein
MFYSPPRNKWLGDLIEMDDPESARASARKLKREFKQSKTRARKVKIKRATVLAANRARAAARKRNLSRRERKELLEIAEIYEAAYKEMDL